MKRWTTQLCVAAMTLAIAGIAGVPAHAIGPDAVRTNAGFSANTLAANDDGSTGLVPIGSPVNLFGTTYTELYVNNNGNVTFDSPLETYTPFPLSTTSRVIMAPFFADVDTRGVGSASVTYGSDTVDGHAAFGVNWVGVGYYNGNDDKLNDFQLVIIDRSDLGAGNFDFEFNYDRILWETGDASGGLGGLGGDSARAGFSNGSGATGSAYEISGSATNGALLDANTTTGLVNRSLNTTQLGRFLFSARLPSAPLNVSATPGSSVGDIIVSWSTPTTGQPITNYRVCSGTAAGGPYGACEDAAASLSHTVSGLTPLTSYYFVVTAQNVFGNGPASAETCMKPFPWLDTLDCII